MSSIEIGGTIGVSRRLDKLPHRLRSVPDVRLGVGQEDSRRTAWAARWCTRCGIGAERAEKLSSRKISPIPSIPPSSRRVFVSPVAVAKHFGEQDQPHWDHAAVGARELCTAFSMNRASSEPGAIGPSLIRPRARPISASTKAACWRSKSSTGAELMPSSKSDIERPQKPGRGHPEIVAHQQERLAAQSVALAQCPHQLSVDSS